MGAGYVVIRRALRMVLGLMPIADAVRAGMASADATSDERNRCVTSLHNVARVWVRYGERAFAAGALDDSERWHTRAGAARDLADMLSLGLPAESCPDLAASHPSAGVKVP